MANRRLARQNRSKQKKKGKLAKKSSISETENKSAPLSVRSAGGKKKVLAVGKKKHTIGSRRGEKSSLVQLKKKKSEILKRQAVEKMVFKERLQELLEKKNRMRKGENVKVERRELGKYIRQLQSQLAEKHKNELTGILEDLAATTAPPTGTQKNRRLLAPGVPVLLYRHQKEDPNEDDQDWVDENDDDDNNEPMLHEDVIQMFSHLTA